MEALFFIEILTYFFTPFKDNETFESVYSLKKIATNYIINEGFIFHFLACFPYHFIWGPSHSDPNADVLRNIMVLKMLRITRLSGDSIPEETILIFF